jgi:hypothetical protein
LPHQVEALVKYDYERNVNYTKQALASIEEGRNTAEGELRKEMGKAFDSNLALAKKLIGNFADDNMKAIVDGGLGDNPAFIRFMVKISKHFGEDGSFLGEAQPSLTMSPEEAKKEIAKIQGAASSDPKHPYLNKLHPEHEALTKRMAQLFQMAYPNA